MNMGRSLTYKILEDIKNENQTINSAIIEALQYNSEVNGMDRFELSKALYYLHETLFDYTYGDRKKEFIEECIRLS